MRHLRPAMILCSLLGAVACGSASDSTQGSESELSYAGGWDGADTRGSSVLLLRDDLRGTLTASIFGDAVYDYRMSYDVNGEIDEDNMLVMKLACMDGAQAETVVDPTPDDGISPEQDWVGIDCSGWELELACSLAGDCESGGGCNMICDIVGFGDAFAYGGLPLEEVENQFDMWKRV
ncbi:MAG: hypothetical protein B7733_00255 [Myxococcales bacterium FL481]|nr:MAG: hypothetical protein B7733_00255 [Myxococcales bacterium FL481]